MGFVSGFTGGVTLTLSAAYLSALAHRRNREQQGRALRAQALELQTLVDPVPLPPLPPTRSEVAAGQRAATVEVLKERWNDEVGRAVRWVQTTDWEEVREGAQAQAGAVWGRILGETPAQTSAAEAAAAAAKGSVESKAGSVAESARAGFRKAKAEARSAEEAAQHKALEARLAARKTASEVVGNVEAAAKEEVREAGGFLSSLFGRGRERAAELAGKAKEAVGLAAAGGGAAVAAIDGVTLSTGSSAVEKALHQRYEKTAVKDTRTAAQVLKERYTPMDSRDNTNLRGL